jgi:ACS family hexuronate transporter-like MFS transporter
VRNGASATIARENTSDFLVVRVSGVPEVRATGGAWSVALCTLAMAAGSYATLGFAPLAPLIREDFSLERWQVGAITAIVFAGAAITAAPSGRLTDRFGAAPMLAAAVAAVACGCGLVALAPGAFFFLIGVGAVGLAYGLITPPTNVIVRGAPTTRHRSLLMSIKQVGVTIGGFISGITMPTIAHHIGWRLALLAPAAACAAVALSALLSRRTLAQNAGEGRRVSAIGLPHGDLPRRFALGVGGFGFVMGGLQIAFVTYLSLYLKEAHGYALAAAGISLAVTMAAGTVGRLLWAVISDRFFAARRASGLRLNALLSVAGMAGLALVPSGALIWPCVALVGFANIGWNGVYMTLVAEAAPSGQIGRVSGSSLRVVFAGAVVVPPLLGLVADSSGWTAAWLGACGLAALAALSMSAAVVAHSSGAGLQSSDLNT